MAKIPLARPQISRQERKAVIRVLKSRNLAQGPEVRNFELEFSRVVGDRDCVAVNSGTSALHLCLLSSGIGSGDEVIVPSFTFAATANVVALVGAKPIFVDIDQHTFCIDTTLIPDAISKNTRAIIAVHLYGMPANMMAIKKIANEHSLLVIEDAAQAHLASINQQVVGTFGDAAAFSFYPTKNMTTGEGGMIVLGNSELARKSRLLRNQGMEIRYQNEIPGYNLRMTDLHASIGRVQLRKLAQMTEYRIRNAEYLSEHLETEFVPRVPFNLKHVFHQYTIRIPKIRNYVSDELTKAGIGNDVYYPTQVHRLPAYNLDLDLPVSLKATQEVLSLPVHPGLNRRQLRRIANTFNQIMRKK